MAYKAEITSNNSFDILGESGKIEDVHLTGVLADKGNVDDKIDKIVDIFIAKRRRALIDVDPDGDLVSKEESEFRIYVGLKAIAVVMCLICNVLLVYQIYKHMDHSENSIINVTYTKKLTFSHPSTTFLFKNGHIRMFKMNGIYFNNHSWTFKIPTNKHSASYFPYTYQRKLHVIYSDAKKDITVLDYKNDRFVHSNIPNSKITQTHYFTGRHVQVGYQFWIYGGLKNSVDPNVLNLFPNILFDPANNVKSEANIWNIERKTFYPGPNPKLQKSAIIKSFPIALNRTHVLLLYFSSEEFIIEEGQSSDPGNYTFTNVECLEGSIYSFTHYIWSSSKPCIHKIDRISDFIIMGQQYFDKTGSK